MTVSVSVPTGLSASAASASQISLSWTAMTGATSYKVYRGGSNIASPTANSYSDTGLTAGTAYSYTVSAVNADGETSKSSAASATTQSGGGGGGGGGVGDTTAPGISGISDIPSDTTATIAWKTNESSITWLVYGTSTAYGLESKTTAYITSHSLVLTGLTPKTTYHYQVKSKDSTGNIGSYTDKTFTTLSLGEKPPVVEVPPVVAKPISEMTVTELRAEIARILALISQLQARLGLGKPIVAEIPAGFAFAKNLSAGMSNSDVVYLKNILDVEVPDHAKWTGTKFFGSKVKAAVVKFQKKYSADISASAGYTIKASGFVGAGTRAKLNQLLGK